VAPRRMAVGVRAAAYATQVESAEKGERQVCARKVVQSHACLPSLRPPPNSMMLPCGVHRPSPRRRAATSAALRNITIHVPLVVLPGRGPSHRCYSSHCLVIKQPRPGSVRGEVRARCAP